jgi:hypothetical protein
VLSRPAAAAAAAAAGACDGGAWASCLAAARVALLHCGHFVEDSSVYSAAPGGDGALPRPLPGNPVAMRGPAPGADGASSALCTLAATAGDGWCASLGAGGARRRRRFEAVLAHYWEPVGAVAAAVAAIRAAHADAHVTIYAKGPPGGKMSNKGAQGASHEQLSALADELLLLPNVGREGHSYLTHIVGRYHALAEMTLFIQAAPAADFVARLGLLTNATGVLNMGGMDGCTCEGSAAFPFVRLRELYALTQHRFCPYVRGASFKGFMNGMFAVSRARVHGQPHELYRYLLGLLDAPPEHFTHSDAADAFTPDHPEKVDEFSKLDGRDGNWNAANYFSYMLERGWAVIFSCMRQEMSCCNGGVCKPGDCQCENDE